MSSGHRSFEPRVPTAIRAIEAWQANTLTTFTPSNILQEFGAEILAGLRAMTAPAPTELLKLADEIDGSISVVVRRRDNDGSVGNTHLMAAHREAIVAALRQAASVERAEVAEEAICCRAQGPDSACFCPPSRRKALWLASTITSHRPGTPYKGTNADNVRLGVQMLIDELAILASPPRSEGVRGSEVRSAGAICPNCHDANSCGDYEGPTCAVCMGTGRVAQASWVPIETADERIREFAKMRQHTIPRGPVVQLGGSLEDGSIYLFGHHALTHEVQQWIVIPALYCRPMDALAVTSADREGK